MESGDVDETRTSDDEDNVVLNDLVARIQGHNNLLLQSTNSSSCIVFVCQFSAQGDLLKMSNSLKATGVYKFKFEDGLQMTKAKNFINIRLL